MKRKIIDLSKVLSKHIVRTSTLSDLYNKIQSDKCVFVNDEEELLENKINKRFKEY